jgi:hypothetical protein
MTSIWTFYFFRVPKFVYPRNFLYLLNRENGNAPRLLKVSRYTRNLMAHKSVPIALPDSDILPDDEDCPHLDKITDYLKDLASKTSKTVFFKTSVPTLEIYETNRLSA